jgi:F-type H+-transporting ATPase subunit delta
VRVSEPLKAADRKRLQDSLAKQYGRDIHINEVVDPSVLGGIRVELGDDVIDGTVSSRLDDARRRLVG